MQPVGNGHAAWRGQLAFPMQVIEMSRPDFVPVGKNCLQKQWAGVVS
jgi:hypothetical protein